MPATGKLGARGAEIEGAALLVSVEEFPPLIEPDDEELELLVEEFPPLIELDDEELELLVEEFLPLIELEVELDEELDVLLEILSIASLTTITTTIISTTKIAAVIHPKGFHQFVATIPTLSAGATNCRKCPLGSQYITGLLLQ